VEVFIRQAHPGPGAPAYRSFDQKLEDARRYVREEGIPWTVAVDDLDGTVHQTYGGLADPSYLIGVDGRVAYYELWTHAPTLHRKMAALVAQGGRGVVGDGVDHVPHLLAALTDGWNALRKGLPQSVIDLELAAPGSAALTWLGHQLRPILAPLTLRAEPLPRAARIALAGLAGVAGVAVLTGLARVARKARA
jgi:hypothetical protein